MASLMKYRRSVAERIYGLADALVLQPYSILRHIWRQLLIIFAMMAFGAAIYAYYQGLDPLTALVASVSTITTIGFYSPPISSMPASEKVLMVVVMLISVGSAASMVQGIVTSAVKKELWVEDVERMRIRRMNDHVIIIGYTQIGRYVSQRLIEMGYRFCVVTRRKENAKELAELDVPFIVSDLKSPVDVLSQANVQSASAVIVALEDDDANMLYALAAKMMRPGIRAVAISNDPNLAEGMRKAGVDVVLPVYFMVGSVAAYSVASEGVLGAIHGGDSAISGRHIVQVTVREGSALDGVPLRDVPADVLLVIRKGEVLKYLSPEFVVEGGDILVCLTDHGSLRLLNGMNARPRGS